MKKKLEPTVITVTADGTGMRTKVDYHRSRSRGGKGMPGIRVPELRGNVVGSCIATDADDLILTTRKGCTIRFKCKELRVSGRRAMGVRLIRCDVNDSVASIATVVK